MSEILSKLYLELANVVPAETLSSREIRLGRIADGSEGLRRPRATLQGPCSMTPRIIPITARAADPRPAVPGQARSIPARVFC